MDNKTNAPRQKTIIVLDGVRAIACLSVIVYHIYFMLFRAYGWTNEVGLFVYNILISGWAGVDLFFVLSGFLLFMPYARSMLFERTWPSTRTFYWRRVLRILPGYYLTLLILLFTTHPEYLQSDHWKGLVLFFTFLMDAPSTYEKINGPFWTLAIEWQYYMLLPLFAWGFSMLVRRGRSPRQRLWLILLCLAAMIAWGLGTRYLGLHQDEYSGVLPQPLFHVIILLIYGDSGKYFEVFAVGMLLCTLFVFANEAAITSAVLLYVRRASVFLFALGLAVLLLMCVWTVYHSLAFLHAFIGAHVWLNEMGFALGYGLCIFALLFGFPWLRLPFEWAPLRWIGKISFSLYMWHEPILIAFRSDVVPRFTQVFSTTAAIYWLCFALVIIPFSYFFYRLIEYPGIQLAHRSRTKENGAVK